MKIKILHRGFNFSQDGPGNRLVYHLQGCNFRCPWCSNPESISTGGALMVTVDKLGEDECPHGAVKDGKLQREMCSECKSRECLEKHSGNIKLSCYEQSINEVIREIESSKMMFFSGGGVTFTGGEPTIQFEAVKEILIRCRKKGIHTAMETNLSHPKIDELSELIDYLIVDCKHYDCRKHKDVIGRDNEQVIDNLRKISKKREQLLIHIPLVHNFNSSQDDAENFAKLFTSLDNGNICVEVLRYHEYGKDKWKHSGMEYKMENGFVDDEEYRAFIEILKNNGIKVVRT